MNCEHRIRFSDLDNDLICTAYSPKPGREQVANKSDSSMKSGLLSLPEKSYSQRPAGKKAACEQLRLTTLAFFFLARGSARKKDRHCWRPRSALKKRSRLRRGFGFGRARSFGLLAFAFDVALASCALFHFVRLLAHRSLHSRCVTFS
jgi:hypothetical protein